MNLVEPPIEDYARANTTPVPELLEELRHYTYNQVELPQMQVGQLEGMFLKVLARSIGARRIVEVGTYTGYSGLMLASALPEDGELVTCDISEHHAAIARRFFDRSPHGDRITMAVGPAAETLKNLKGTFDMAFIDADKGGYITYFELIRPLMRPGGLIVADNVLWSGRVLDDPAKQSQDTRAITAFNRHIQSQADLDKVMLTVRDGMTLIVV